ncbi:MAG: electron transfer flavoprotein subunit beta/FixA family protein [Proteobacteria bacterium]|nr:electron transfer flavoprotein subunit beta/FixA family protein [Pseudomonadota bacterium]
MKILVPVKRVIDAYTKPRVKSDGSGVETNNVKMSANPFDEIAVEQALRLKEAGICQEVIVVAIGPSACQEMLRGQLAVGADQAILVETNQEVEPLSVAKILKKIVEKTQPSLVIMGKQAIDDDCNQTGQMLAALLDWPQATFAAKVTVNNQQVVVTREIDGGHQTVSFEIPGIITTDLRLNTPRFAKLPDIMKARQKKIETIPVQTLEVDLKVRLATIKVEPPAARKSGIAVNSVDELLDKLRNIEKVIK